MSVNVLSWPESLRSLQGPSVSGNPAGAERIEHGSRPESFRPWGWAAVDAVILFAIAGVALAVAATWQLVLFAPAWGLVLFRSVLTMCVNVTIVDQELTWRTMIGSRVVPVDLAMSVRPRPGLGAGVVRIIDFADGQKIQVGEGPEFDRLLRSLQRRVKDLEVHELRWPL